MGALQVIGEANELPEQASGLAKIPAASVCALLEGMKEAGFNPGDLGIFETLMDARSLFLTANSTTVYCMTDLNVKDGPIVAEIPPGVLGPVDDAFFCWVTDIGLTGPDQGKGGKYLFAHRDYKGAIPEGYFVCRTPTYRNLIFFHAFVKGGESADAEIRQSLRQKVQRRSREQLQVLRRNECRGSV